MRQERGRIENIAETREEELTSSFNQQFQAQLAEMKEAETRAIAKGEELTSNFNQQHKETIQSLQAEITHAKISAEIYEKVALSKSKPEKTSELLSVAVKKFINEHSGKSWDENTTNETTAILNVMLEIIGDIPVHLLSSTIAREFKDKLQKMPRNKNKDKRYRDLPLEEIFKMEVSTPMSTTTINKYISRVSSFNEYLLNNYGDDVKRNYFYKNGLTQSKSSSEQRDVITSKELALIFDGIRDYKVTKSSTTEGKSCKSIKPFHYWTVVLALATGARQNELASLSIDSIYYDDHSKLWGIDFKEQVSNGKIKKLKTKSSVRSVPLSDELLRLGLHTYAEQMKLAGHSYLFPELIDGKTDAETGVTRWFNTKDSIYDGFRYRAGITEERIKEDKICYHSLRYNFATALEQNMDVPELLTKRTLGHATTGETASRYSKGQTLKNMKCAVETPALSAPLKVLPPFSEWIASARQL